MVINIRYTVVFKTGVQPSSSHSLFRCEGLSFFKNDADHSRVRYLPDRICSVYIDNSCPLLCKQACCLGHTDFALPEENKVHCRGEAVLAGVLPASSGGVVRGNTGTTL